ncbi:MAG TPA: hypothetical protein VKF14_19835 [Candidatus Dormibacteraeota bacterium]|nr:hypothetical protein [Candidatus Dormibacteraeota bacterium]
MAIDPFGQAELRYEELVEERRGGAMDARAFRDAIRDIRVRDMEGREWVLGPTDGQWYRRDRDRWLEDKPPRRLICPSCSHHNLPRHSFCTQCGGRLPR